MDKVAIRGLNIAVSKVSDGSMKITGSPNPQDIVDNRIRFFERNNLVLTDAVLVPLTYGGDNYCRYSIVDGEDKSKGINKPFELEADGLLTQTKGLVLFLPLADCIGAVLYDPTTNSLMLTHLGRHNLEQDGGRQSVVYMTTKTGANPADIKAWLGPAADATNYPLISFAGASLHQVATRQLQSAGILSENISKSPIDTTSDDNYYSHSQFKKGKQEIDGRFAVAVMMI